MCMRVKTGLSLAAAGRSGWISTLTFLALGRDLPSTLTRGLSIPNIGGSSGKSSYRSAEDHKQLVSKFGFSFRTAQIVNDIDAKTPVTHIYSHIHFALLNGTQHLGYWRI